MSIVILIITVMASGVLAAVVAYRLNATKEHVFFMRQKVEALYLSMERYDRFLGSHLITYYSVLKNEISYNELLDLQISNGNPPNTDSAVALDTAIMLVNVYFSDLKVYLDRYTSTREKINKIIAALERAYKRGDTDGSQWFKQFHDAMQELDRAAQAFKQAILSEAVDLARPAQLWPQSLRAATLWSRAVRFAYPVPSMRRRRQ